ncbi:MAG: hypothetical protein RR957_07375 [Oscillospiraceae bacterium]
MWKHIKETVEFMTNIIAITVAMFAIIDRFKKKIELGDFAPSLNLL